jgi:hypothetical protein
MAIEFSKKGPDMTGDGMMQDGGIRELGELI